MKHLYQRCENRAASLTSGMRADLHYTLTRVDGAVASCELTPRYNTRPASLRPSSCSTMRWGLLPRWRGHGGTRGPLVHAAPFEAVPATPLLRDAFKSHAASSSPMGALPGAS